MVSVNYSTLRENLKSYLDTVTDDFETLTVTRKGGQNVVIISEDSYNNMIENIYIRQDKANYEWLMESKKQYEEGKVRFHTLDE